MNRPYAPRALFLLILLAAAPFLPGCSCEKEPLEVEDTSGAERAKEFLLHSMRRQVALLDDMRKELVDAGELLVTVRLREAKAALAEADAIRATAEAAYDTVYEPIGHIDKRLQELATETRELYAEVQSLEKKLPPLPRETIAEVARKRNAREREWEKTRMEWNKVSAPLQEPFMKLRDAKAEVARIERDVQFWQERADSLVGKVPDSEVLLWRLFYSKWQAWPRAGRFSHPVYLLVGGPTPRELFDEWAAHAPNGKEFRKHSPEYFAAAEMLQRTSGEWNRLMGELGTSFDELHPSYELLGDGPEGSTVLKPEILSLIARRNRIGEQFREAFVRLDATCAACHEAMGLKVSLSPSASNGTPREE